MQRVFLSTCVCCLRAKFDFDLVVKCDYLWKCVRSFEKMVNCSKKNVSWPPGKTVMCFKRDDGHLHTCSDGSSTPSHLHLFRWIQYSISFSGLILMICPTSDLPKLASSAVGGGFLISQSIFIASLCSSLQLFFPATPVLHRACPWGADRLSCSYKQLTRLKCNSNKTSQSLPASWQLLCSNINFVGLILCVYVRVCGVCVWYIGVSECVMGVWGCERTIVCNITKSRMEQGSRCFALRIVISITSLPVCKKGEPTRENHVR